MIARSLQIRTGLTPPNTSQTATESAVFKDVFLGFIWQKRMLFTVLGLAYKTEGLGQLRQPAFGIEHMEILIGQP